MNNCRERTFNSCLPKHTFRLGYIVGLQLVPTTVVTLTGDLGSGKTIFVKGLADGLGIPDAKYVNSPTYNLINKYVGRFTLYHVDLYRINPGDDLYDIGLLELLSSKAITAIEWPEKVNSSDLPDKCLDISFEVGKGFGRKISMVPRGFPLRASLNTDWNY